MKRFRIVLLAVVLAGAVIGGWYATACTDIQRVISRIEAASTAGSIQYSAKLVTTIAWPGKGNIQGNSDFYSKKGMERTDIHGRRLPDYIVQTRIDRYDRHLTWTIFPKERCYIETPMTEPRRQGDQTRDFAKLTSRISHLGSSVVNGRRCEGLSGEQVEYSTATGKNTKIAVHIVTVWIDPKLGMVIKRVSVRHPPDVTIHHEKIGPRYYELRDIRFAPQSDSLFDLPAGYRKTDIAPYWFSPD